MKSNFKDFLYDTSDLIVAVVIAILVIFSFYSHINVFFLDLFNATTVSQNADESTEQIATDMVINDKEVTINIPDNAVSSDVIDILYENNLISSKSEVREYLEKNDLSGKLGSGEFKLNTSMSKEEIIAIISKGIR